MKKPMKRFWLLYVAAGLTFAAFAFSGCDTLTEMVEANVPQTHGGPPAVVVRLHEQQAYLYRGGHLVAASRISSGREGHRTPIGKFRIIRKDEDHRSSIYGDYVNDAGEIVKANVDVRRDARPPHSHFEGAPMPFFMEFAPGYGLHQGYLPGQPASHGCIRMPYWKARQFFSIVHVGTPITIQP
jgi:lipoprotein-anchoring transpeptidase ErfK/SrfK